ncbi:electron transport complex subunit RsxA [bacterium]|nr:electron transport complex subunit RsxA [bacterium]
MNELILIFLSSVLVNNFVLARFLGICPFLGVSKSREQALGMSCAMILVTVSASGITYCIYHNLLVPLHLEFLQIIAFILVIAGFVQLVEIVMIKSFPHLYRALGIYLPLITTNCVIMAVVLLQVVEKYSLLKSLVFSAGAGAGFALALILMAGIRERLEFSDIPESLKGASITLITAGLLSLAFMGFSGLVKM